MNKGDYVRTKDGLIGKIVDVKENPYGEKTIFELDREINIFDLEMGDMYLMTNPLAEETTNKIDTHFGDDKIIIKSSPNIIDLIEVGDYVNGYKVNVIQIWKDEITLICNDYNLDDSAVLLTNKDIKTIVTREQFSAMEYKVESEVK